VADVLTEAVASAISAVAVSLPTLAKRMTAGGHTASVALTRRAEIVFPQNLGGQVWNSNGVNVATNVVANVVDFPNLAEGMPVRIDGTTVLVVGLRKVGEAAWFVGLSNPLHEAIVQVEGVRAESCRFTTSATAAVTYTGYDDNGQPNDISTADVYVAKPGAEPLSWSESTAPEIGDVVTMKSGEKYAVRSVQEYPNSWLLKARRTA